MSAPGPEGVRHAGHMTSVLANIAVDCTDPDRLAQFWCAVLGWEVLEHDDGIVSIGLPDGPGSGPGHPAGIDLLEVAEPTAGKNRLHLDLRAAPGTSAQEELARLDSLGATRADVGQDPEVSWTVLADPEGNVFCLLGTGPG